MSVVEQARARLEEARTRIKTRIEEMRGGSSPLLGGGILGGKTEGSPELPTLKEVREKGILRVLEERFPRVKEIREKGILARPIVEAREEVEKKEIVVEEGPAVTGVTAVRETRLSVEV